MEQQTIPVTKFSFKSLGSNDSVSTPNINPAFRTLPQNTQNNLPRPSSNSLNKEKEQPKEPSFSEKEILEAKQKSFEEGYAKGYSGAKSAEVEIEKQIQVSLSDVTIKLAAIGEAVKTRNNEHIKELTELVMRVARKVAGTALKNEPYSEIENVISYSLPLLFDEPKISIFVNPTLVSNIEGRITTLAKNEGFKNNIEISGNPALPYGSCDIEWHGGGIRSNKDMVWGQIEKLCENL